MIWLYNSNSLVSSYKNFDDVCDYFRRLEHFKAADRDSFYPGQFSAEKWEFSYYSYDHLGAIFGEIKRNIQLTKVEQEAYENELDLIEVCTGAPQTLQQIILFPDVDITELMRNWCFDYAHAKNFALFEIISGDLDLEKLEEHVPASCGYQSFLHHSLLE